MRSDPRPGQTPAVGLASALAVALTACGEPDVEAPGVERGGPAGALTGTIVYRGVAPCTAGGRVIGSAVILAFDERAVPPPDGFGTAPVRVDIVPGDELFRGVRLDFDPDGKRRCPSGPNAPVSSTAGFALAPLPAGRYQIRGFFDYDGDFDPLFSISAGASRGDVAGGAIDNLEEALAGAAPRFTRFVVGERRDGRLVIPDEGFVTEGIAATLGLRLPTERPLFHAASARLPGAGGVDASRFAVPADFQLAPTGPEPDAIEAAFPAYVLRAGVPAGEVEPGGAAPLALPVDAAAFPLTRVDANRDGTIDEADVALGTAIPSLGPLPVFTRIPASGTASGTVALFGIPLAGSLAETLAEATAPDFAATPADLPVLVPPAVLCLPPRGNAVWLAARATNAAGQPTIPDETAFAKELEARLGRPVEVAYGCLPTGAYALNLVLATGQTWTLPNEAGVCAPTEPLGEGGSRCGSRPRLPSQAAVFVVGPPGDAAYCAANPPPAACAVP